MSVTERSCTKVHPQLTKTLFACCAHASRQSWTLLRLQAAPAFVSRISVAETKLLLLSFFHPADPTGLIAELSALLVDFGVAELPCWQDRSGAEFTGDRHFQSLAGIDIGQQGLQYPVEFMLEYLIHWYAAIATHALLTAPARLQRSRGVHNTCW